MIFSPNKELIDYSLNIEGFSNEGISKVLLKSNEDFIYGCLTNYLAENEYPVLEDVELIKVFSTIKIPDKYVSMYKYISDKYLCPYSDILEIVFNTKIPNVPENKFEDFYVSLDFGQILGSSFKKYQDIVDFILEKGDLKYSQLLKNFSKRRVNTFLSKIEYDKIERGLENTEYLPLDILAENISKIADSKLRLFVFPSSSLKNEMYDKIPQKDNIFNEIPSNPMKGFKPSKHNIYFGSPLTLLMPFSWDEIIIVDLNNDLYKLNYSPYFDLRDIIKKFFHNSVLHFRAPSFKSYKYFNIDLDFPNKDKITFKKSDLSIKELIDSALLENKKVLFMTNHSGYASRVKCKKCGQIQKCPNCLRPLVYQESEGAYTCLGCGYTTKDLICSNCKSDEFEYFSFGTEYFKNKFSYITSEIALFDSNNRNIENLNSQFVIATTSIFYHFAKSRFDLIILDNIDNFIFMDYRSRDRLLTLIIKLSSLLSKNGEILSLYKSNIFNFSSPLYLEFYYGTEDTERRNFKFPPYYDIIYVICDTSQLKLDYLFGKLMLFLRQYNVVDYEVFKREEFGKGVLTIKMKEKDLRLLKLFFNDYKDEIKIYVNTERDMQ